MTNTSDTPSEPMPDRPSSVTASGFPTTPARQPSYWDYNADEILECPGCRWSGPGSGHEEPFRDLFDVKCPECDRILLVVSYPTSEEARSAAAAGNTRAISALPELDAREERRRRRDKFELTDPAALPDLDGDALVIEWDLISDGSDGWTVLRHGDVELWRELAYYEGEERFEVIAAILQAKYGERFVEFRPTPASELYLYGDRSTGGAIRVNQALREHRNV